MKLMIASDIHGSAYWCGQMAEAYKREKAERLLLLGDILYHGPRNELPKEYDPKQVFAMLNEMSNEILCVRGNCDSEVDQMVLSFPVMAEYAILYAGKHMIYAAHGHHFGEQNPPPLKFGDYLLNGHTHVPACQEYDSFTYLNPGSVSLPKEGSEHGYMMLDENKFIWKSMDGKAYKEHIIELKDILTP